MHTRNAYVVIGAITNSISDFCLSIAAWKDEICSRMANWERISAIRRHFTLTRKNTRAFGHAEASRPSDAASYKRRGSLILPGPLKPRVLHVHTRMASFNRTKLRVITCKRALKRLRFKGIRRPVRVVLMHIRIYIRVCAFVYARESARERNYACMQERSLHRRANGRLKRCSNSIDIN